MEQPDSYVDSVRSSRCAERRLRVARVTARESKQDLALQRTAVLKPGPPSWGSSWGKEAPGQDCPQPVGLGERQVELPGRHRPLQPAFRVGGGEQTGRGRRHSPGDPDFPTTGLA